MIVDELQLNIVYGSLIKLDNTAMEEMGRDLQVTPKGREGEKEKKRERREKTGVLGLRTM